MTSRALALAVLGGAALAVLAIALGTLLRLTAGMLWPLPTSSATAALTAWWQSRAAT